MLDPITVTREWPAAELESALWGKALTGVPDILILVSPELALGQPTAALPVFDAVLRVPGTFTDDQPRLISVTDSTASTIASELRPQWYSSGASVLPDWMDGLWRLLMYPIMLALFYVVRSSPPLGCLAGIWVVLNWGLTVEASAVVKAVGGIDPAYLICGFWLGLAGRLTIYSRFEVKYPIPSFRYIFVFHCLALGGIMGVLALLSPYVSLLAALWATLLGGWGWILANWYLHYTTFLKGNPRPSGLVVGFLAALFTSTFR